MTTNRRIFLKTITSGAASLLINPSIKSFGNGSNRPNIILLMAEDIGPDLRCYGVKGVQTPFLDRLASQGIRYTNAFCTSPVCSPSRSALMVGMHQNAFGANQHRTRDKKSLPYPLRPITHLLRDAGYYTANGCGYSAKTDLNFKADRLFDGKDWNKREPDQPFFAQITFANTHRKWGRDPIRPIDPEDVEIPPYYPDHPLVRRDWANGLEEIQIMDRKVGKILKRLEDERIADNTAVIFIGDNGRCHIRGKQFLYDGGIHIPLMVRWPEHIESGKVSGDLVSTVDIPRTILGLADVEVPEYMHGRNFLNPKKPPRKYIFAARDKMDDTHDAMRAVRSKNVKYILNLMPERAYCQFNHYKEMQYPVLALMNVLHMKGKLTPEQDHFMRPGKPDEELYDLLKDPHELKNRAADSDYQTILQEIRTVLSRWQERIHDQGITGTFRNGGWPATYPTRSLEEWQKILKAWEAHLFESKPHPRKLIESLTKIQEMD